MNIYTTFQFMARSNRGQTFPRPEEGQFTKRTTYVPEKTAA